MDIIFALIAIYQELHGRRAVPAYIFLSLISNFWSTLQNFSWPFPHRMVDLGIVLGVIIVLIPQSANKRDKNTAPLIGRLLLLAAGNFLISMVIAFGNGIPFIDVYKALRFFYGTVLVFTVLAALSADDLKRLLKYILITNVVISVLILVQFQTGIPFFKYELQSEIYSEMGTYGLYPPESLWLSFALLCSAFAVRIPIFWRGVGIALCLFVALLTMIRSFCLIFAISAGVMVLASITKKRLLESTMLLLLIGISCYILYETPVFNRLFSDNDKSFEFRIDDCELAIRYCNYESPYWGGDLRNIAVDEDGAQILADEKSAILSSSDHNGAFFLKFGWCGVISWLLLLWLPPLLIFWKYRRSPFMVPLLLCCFVYIPISAMFSNRLLRPYGMIPYILLYMCVLKVDTKTATHQIVEKKYPAGDDKV